MLLSFRVLLSVIYLRTQCFLEKCRSGSTDTSHRYPKPMPGEKAGCNQKYASLHYKIMHNKCANDLVVTGKNCGNFSSGQ